MKNRRGKLQVKIGMKAFGWKTFLPSSHGSVMYSGGKFCLILSSGYVVIYRERLISAGWGIG
jgi:hypothetical protein